MQLMKEGDEWELYIPSELAYGEAGAGGDIPGGAALVFTMEIKKVHGKKAGEIHEELKQKFTTGGGGYKGFCDYEEIKEAIKECDGLDGDRLEACYAQFGCDIDQVTDHYAKAAGIKKKEKENK